MNISSLFKTIVVCFLGLFVVLSAASASKESLTYDEIVHIEEGIAAWKKHEFRVDTNNPPLIRELAVVPLLIAGTTLKTLGQPNLVVFSARMVIVFLGVLLGIYIFLESKLRFGVASAVFALFLFAFEPSILAHSHYVTQDMGASLFFFVGYMSLIHMMNKPSWKQFLIHGVCMGCMFAAKITTIPYYFVSALLVAPYLLRGRVGLWFSSHPIKIAASVLSCFIVIWMTYFFSVNVIIAPSDARGRVSQNLRIFANEHRVTSLIVILNFLEHQPMPLGDYIAVLKNTAIRSTRPQQTFFLGTYYPKPKWYFMMVNFFLKTPLPLVLLMVVGVAVGLRVKKYRRNTIIVLIPILSMFFVSMISSMQPFVRYMLPVYPFIFLLGGLSLQLSGHKVYHLFLGVCSIWYIGGIVLAYPHFISYANEFAGSKTTLYTKFTDSNLDWGQGLISLKKIIDEKKPSSVHFSYFGRDDAARYGFLSTMPFGSYKSNEICAFHDIYFPKNKGTPLTIISSSNWHECGYYLKSEFSAENVLIFY